jgi:adenylate cyclase class IV
MQIMNPEEKPSIIAADQQREVKKNIEVEKKFSLTDEQEMKLLEGAEFLGEKKFTDTYYDDDRYSLTTKDTWLRSREGRFELKVPLNVAIEERVTDRYRELETDEEIAGYLNLPEHEALADALREIGYNPFATIVTTRRKYKKDGYGIDLDIADFGYNIAEIEYMTDEESKIQDATQKLVEYATAHGLSESSVILGKVVEYLRRNDPVHFQALIEAKVIRY